MKTYQLTAEIEVDDDDNRGSLVLEQVVREALNKMQEWPYIEYADVKLELEE